MFFFIRFQLTMRSCSIGNLNFNISPSTVTFTVQNSKLQVASHQGYDRELHPSPSVATAHRTIFDSLLFLHPPPAHG